jgi:hypothetical protein
MRKNSAVVPGRPSGPNLEPMNTGQALDFLKLVFIDSGLAGKARAPE